MAFQFRYGTSKETVGVRLKVLLESKHFTRAISFPPAGNLLHETLEVPSQDLWDVHCSFFVDNDRSGVFIKRLGPDDSLSVVAFPLVLPARDEPAVLFAGTVWHAAGDDREHCTVICDDGTEGECCVTCQEGRSLTKICC
ncbi:hypothetical protein [Bradyrhizobium sp.]